MKSLATYASKMTEPEYHQAPFWSYSAIARYAKEGFGSLNDLNRSVAATPSMEFGSLFDSILTKGKETLKEYAVIDCTVPDAEKKALDYIVSKTDKPQAKLSELSQEDLTTYCDECGYQMRWGYDARLKHLTPYSMYYDIRRTGRKPVSSDDWADAVEMANIFRNDPYLKNVFGTKNSGHKEYLYQLKFFLDYPLDEFTTVKLKFMPDLLVVDHQEKTVQPVDLKTSSMPAWGFQENFLKFRYDIQATLYSDALRYVMDSTKEYKDYTILPYLFTDISRSDKVPVTFIYDQTDPSQQDGLSFSTDGKTYKYKGWKALLQEILDYQEQKAKVPAYIKLNEPNNILDLLGK